MVRPRKEGRENWPNHLCSRKKNGREYYFWKHPKTAKEYGIGYSLEDAIRQSIDVNARLESSLKKRDLDQKMQDQDEEIAKKYSLVPQRFKRIVGIYFLFLDGEIVYVGQSINVISRIHKHESDGRVFDCFSYIEFEEKFLDAEERKYSSTEYVVESYE